MNCVIFKYYTSDYVNKKKHINKKNNDFENFINNKTDFDMNKESTGNINNKKRDKFTDNSKNKEKDKFTVTSNNKERDKVTDNLNKLNNNSNNKERDKFTDNLKKLNNNSNNKDRDIFADNLNKVNDNSNNKERNKYTDNLNNKETNEAFNFNDELDERVNNIDNMILFKPTDIEKLDVKEGLKNFKEIRDRLYKNLNIKQYVKYVTNTYIEKTELKNKILNIKEPIKNN